MATIIRAPSKTWKALVGKKGWPTTVKTFRTKLDTTASLVGQRRTLQYSRCILRAS